MIKMNYGDGEHRKMLEQSFVALLDNETDRQKEWVRLRKKLYGIDATFKTLLPTQMKKIMILSILINWLTFMKDILIWVIKKE